MKLAIICLAVAIFLRSGGAQNVFDDYDPDDYDYDPGDYDYDPADYDPVGPS